MSVKDQPIIHKRFTASMGTNTEGQPILIFEANGQSFIIQGDNLFKFYAMMKRGMEGETKPPGIV